GLGARDTLRLEKGYCLYGNDIDDTTSPLEAGLGWVTKLDTEFIGKEAIVKVKEAGLKQKMIGLKLIDKGIARNSYEVVNDSSEVIGRVTSGTISPTLNQAIAMAYIDIEEATIGNTVSIKVRNKVLKAEVVKFPFV
ncbi:glycine cleavage system aminomethyltransferase GcvT, partial [Cyclobacteriaceae bacterium]|nr:glycine cleavage system aminomethyltransferase GcvT [Cyclobacteriaceae bacterium]